MNRTLLFTTMALVLIQLVNLVFAVGGVNHDDIRSIEVFGSSNDFGFGEWLSANNKTIQEGKMDSMKNATKLEYDRSVNGTVSLSDEMFIISIYEVTIPHHRYIQWTELYLSLERTSKESGIIYLELYYMNLTKIARGYDFAVKNQYGASIRLNYNDIEEERVYIVIYGNGDYHLFVNEIIISSYISVGLSLLPTCGFFSIIIILIVFAAVIIAGHFRNQNKWKDGQLNDQRYLENHVRMETIKKTLFAISFVIVMALLYIITVFFYSDEFWKIDYLYRFIWISSGVFLACLLIGILLGLGIFWLYKIDMAKKYIRAKKSIFHLLKRPRPFKERMFIIGDKLFSIPVILFMIIFIVQMIFRLFMTVGDGVFFNVLYGGCICCHSFIFIIFLIVLYFGSIYTLDIDENRIIYRNFIRKFEYENDKIDHVRPITASIWFNLYPGLERIDGKWAMIRTGVAIVLKDGTVETFLTSRPMDVIALMGK